MSAPQTPPQAVATSPYALSPARPVDPERRPRALRAALATRRRPLARAQALALYRTMLLSRRVDDLEMQLKRQNLAFFQISGAGHEATLAAATLHLRAGHDWFFPYYRDRALCLGLGVTAADMLLQAVGAAADPASGGRQMPAHWSSPPHHIVSESSPTGVQFLTAVGCAEAGLLLPTLGGGGGRAAGARDEVVYCSAGEGTTSQGMFFEALNTAAMARLPVLFHIEDNGYAISTPVAQQTAGGSISGLVAGYPNLLRLQYDGCCPEESYLAWAEGVAYARARRGPVLMHAHVVRPYSHSMSDDERAYRGAEELAAQAGRDPLPRFRAALIGRYGIGEASLAALEADVAHEVAAARAAAVAAAPPAAKHVQDFVTSPDVDATGPAFAVPAASTGEPLTMVDLINRCLVDEMARSPRTVVFGQDVADAGDARRLGEVRGKGGVFKVTYGLERRFGSDRVFNSPLAEANIIGRAVGMALRGVKPIVEIQFFDYIWPAMLMIRSEVALMRWRSNNGWSCPLVIRCTYGGYLKGGAIYHSQTGASTFTQIPGLHVVVPATAADANGLLRTAIRCDDPVLFLEHKHLYRQPHNRDPYPGPDHMVPFGKAAIRRAGTDVTLVTYGALVRRSLDAAQALAARGISVEVIDMRSLSPYDWPAIAQSVAKTSRALVVHEDPKSWGWGAEIAARISEELFGELDAPVGRVGALDTFVGYHPVLEEAILPQPADIEAAVARLLAY